MTSVKKAVLGDDSEEAGLVTVDMKLEAIVIPVSDVERAEQFYRRLVWRTGNGRRSEHFDIRLNWIVQLSVG